MSSLFLDLPSVAVRSAMRILLPDADEVSFDREAPEILVSDSKEQKGLNLLQKEC